MDRRDFLTAGVAGAAATAIAGSLASSTANAQTANSIIKPEKLQKGDTVMIVAPAGVEYNKFRLQLSVESLEALGLKVKVAENTLGRWGYFPAEDEVRAAELNQAFADKDSESAVFLLKHAHKLYPSDMKILYGLSKYLVFYQNFQQASHYMQKYIYTRAE